MSTVAAPTSPYKGLAAFENSDLDALFFFGRERESDVIAANLMASRLTVLFGASGVGKSSVLRAGVAYRLRQEPDLEVVVHSSWTGDPMSGILETAAVQGESLADALEIAATRAGGDLYLILDQFEEYFLYHERDRSFVEELAGIVRHPGLRVNVLIGIREDALAQLDGFKAVIPNLLSNRLRLERLDRAAGEAAIVRPVQRFNELVPGERRVEVEPELVAAVLVEVAAGRVEFGAAGRGVVDGGGDADRIEAPYLQLVMTRLWEVETERHSRTLRLETLRELGGAARIVEDHLEHAMAELSPREKEAAAAMYNFLVTPSGSKIAHGVRDLAGYAEVDEDEAAKVLRRLTAERIVRASSVNGAATRYEIYHDVLADAVLAWRNRYAAQRALHEAERRRRRALFVAAAALAGLLVVAGIAIFALVERSHARTQAGHARARQLAAQADVQLGIDPLRSIALGIRAARLDDTPEIERALRDALLASHVRKVFRAPDPVVASSPALVALGDGTGRLLMVPTGGDALRVRRLGGPITAVGLSRDGDALAAGIQHSIVLVRGGGEERFAVPEPATAIGVARNGSHLAVGFESGTVRLVHPRKHTIKVRGQVDSLVYSPDSRRLLIVSRDRRARLVDARTGRLLRVLGHEGFVYAATFSPDGRLLATGSADDLARLWDGHTGKLLHVLETAAGAINSVAFTRDSKLVGAASSDGIARVYDARTGLRLVLLNGHATSVTSIAFSPDQKTIVTGSTDRTARIWLTDTGRLLRTLTGDADTVVSAFFTAGGTQAVTASADGTVRIWDPGTAPELTSVLSAADRPITSLAVSADGRSFLTGDQRGRMVRWSLDGTPLRTTDVGSPITDVAFGPQGPVAAVEPQRAVAYASATGLIARGGDDGIVRIAHAGRRGKPIVLRARGEGVQAIAFTSGGDMIATGTADGAVRLWDPRTGKPLRSLRGHRAEVTSAAFAPDGEKLVTTSRDGDARLWNVASGKTVAVLRGHGGLVSQASFSSDGQWVATAGPTTVGIWPVATGRLAFLLHGHGPVIRAVAFAPNSFRIYSAGDDGSVRTYDCVVCRPLRELVRTAEARLASARPR